ncbi:hypothetical protein [Trinickia violacea]|nr:hypothetical protein [Trinickia violacea]
MCRQLVEQRPEVTALYTPMIGQLADIDPRLYSHLFQCQMTHRAFEQALASFEQHDRVFREREKRRAQALRTGEKPGQAFDEEHPHLFAMLDYYAGRALHGWAYCAAHAEFGAYFLDRLIFSRWPNVWHWCRMRLFPNDLDRRSATLLKTGQLSDAGEPE